MCVCLEQIILSETKLYFSQARINRTNFNARLLFPLRIKRKYLHDFSMLVFPFFHILTPFLSPWSLTSLSLSVPSLEFANPYLALHSFTTNFVNRFHSGGFSRSSPLAHSSPPPPSLQRVHRAPLQLPLPSANRFKSSGSHAHKTR